MANLSNINNKFLVTTGGNVGIGDTGPSTRLTVDVPAILNNTVNLFQLGDDTNGLVFKKFWNSSGIAWRLNKGVSGVNMMTFSQDGKIGIGETDPSGYWGQANNIVIDTSGNGGITIKSTNAGNGRLVFTDTKSTTAGNTDGGMITYSHNDDEMRFQTNGSQKMVIDSSGNVGIGTDSPITAGGSYKGMQIKNGAGASLVLSNTSHNHYIYTGGSTGELSIEASEEFRVRTNGSERMRITSDGQVNITKGSSGTVLYLDGTNAYDAETGIQLSVGRARNTCTLI